MEIYWTPPEEIDEADFCVLEYKDSPLLGTPRTPLSIMVPFAKTRDSLVISDLQTVTRFGLRLYCFYGNTRGPPTDWVYAATRTGIEMKPILIKLSKYRHCNLEL